MIQNTSTFPGTLLRMVAALAVAFLFATLRSSLAGPPFVTDDPEPVDFQHWEFYLASMPMHTSAGWSGTLPHLEINYGAVPNLQLHVIAPVAFSLPSEGGGQFGYGDTELGAKYRLFKESDHFPEIGVFPLLEAPTGSERRGLGSGHVHAFLPLWLQKSFGKWTTYGGGGYWINPGPENENWGFIGVLLQRQVAKNLAIGAEIFHETAQTKGGSSDTILNPGLVWDLSDRYHLMASAGHSVQGPSTFVAYGAIQITFGPEHEAAK